MLIYAGRGLHFFFLFFLSITTTIAFGEMGSKRRNAVMEMTTVRGVMYYIIEIFSDMIMRIRMIMVMMQTMIHDDNDDNNMKMQVNNINDHKNDN